MWDNLADVEAFTARDGVIDRYISGEFGTNELYKYRALAVFDEIAALHDVAFQVARDELIDRQGFNERTERYLSELKRFSLMRKQNPLNTEIERKERFHFNFVEILSQRFGVDPFEHECPDGMDIEICHSDEQKRLISGYVGQYGTTLIGLGRILIRANMGRLYRSARYFQDDVALTSSLPGQERLGRFGAIGLYDHPKA